MRALMLLLALALSGCAGMPGQVSTHRSQFDGTQEVHLNPGRVDTPGSLVTYINLGAHWSSKAPDSVLLIARTPQGLHNIRRDGGLQFNIDGDVIALNGVHVLTRHDIGKYPYSERDFAAPLSLVERLSEGTRVKLIVGQSEYYEGVMSSGMGTALDGLRQFLSQVRSLQEK